MQRFTRANPSPRYVPLLLMHRQMHESGETIMGIPADETFAGLTVLRHERKLRAMIEHCDARTLLDYGCGKARAYDRGLFRDLGIDVAKYDPGYPEYAAMPDGQFDGVICVDVLEHCDARDVRWILDEIFDRALRFVFLSISTKPAAKRMPNGDNAHVTVESIDWWVDTIRRSVKPSVDLQVHFD